MRIFDLRNLEHSTIIYEDINKLPLLRLAWNKQDPNYLATMAMDSTEPVAHLNNHRACVNGIAWAPHSSCHICTAADDRQALIWDISSMPRAIEDPILAYTADGEINQQMCRPFLLFDVQATVDHSLYSRIIVPPAPRPVIPSPPYRLLVK
uniref:Uncharacterized protein n=1 Tax=Romanomermis culicivorax TaxID=13658 RepID=A0A915J858_ROMCU